MVNLLYAVLPVNLLTKTSESSGHLTKKSVMKIPSKEAGIFCGSKKIAAPQEKILQIAGG